MPRNPSQAQREASRANGCKSRGPKTSESKQRSAQNSRKWGLFAKTAALPHEQKEFGDRCTVWHEYYQPQSPASMHLTNECARATLLADRCDNYRLAEIEHQTTVERQKWHVGQNRKVDRLAKELPVQTEITYQKLMAFGGGVRWVIQCFQDTIVDVQTHGYLPPKDLDLAIRFFGVTPTPDRIRQDLMAYVVFVYNLACTPGVSPALIQEWLKPGNRPDVMQGIPDDEVIGDPDETREMLIETFEREIDRLRVEERRFWAEVDQPSLERALNRASILTHDAARRVARSHSEARTTYHRATKDLWPLLDRERECPLDPAGDGDQDDTGDAPDAVAQATMEPVAALPMPASRVGVESSENEPEDATPPLAQEADAAEDTVADRPLGLARQNGDSSPVAALPETVSKASAPSDRPAGPDVDAGALVPPATTGMDAMVLAPARDEAENSYNEPENRSHASAQMLDKPMISIDGRLSGSERQNGVSSPSPGLETTSLEPLASADLPALDRDDPSGEPARLPEWAASIPVSASHRVAGLRTQQADET